MTLQYLDFDVEIGDGAGRDYPVSAKSWAGDAHATMHLPYDELALESRLKDLQIALLRAGGKRRQMLLPEEKAVRDFGRALFDSMFTGEVRNRYDVSLQQARTQGKGLRIRLCFRSPLAAALPWEYLFDPRQAEFCCLSAETPLVRYLELPQPIVPLMVAPPLRILGMIASPSDLSELDIDQERRRIEQATQGLRETGRVELEWLPGQTWRDLQGALRHGPWHVFHFSGHGRFDTLTDEGQLAFTNDQGRAHLLPASEVGRLLANHRTLRMAWLNACEGARGGELDVFSSTASILVRRGIPAVVAMQYEITDRAAIELARTFYESVADGYPVDAALAEARVAISLAVNNTLEWGTPVLYMRAPDGVLFALTESPRPVPVPAPPVVPKPEPPKPPLGDNTSVPESRGGSHGRQWLSVAVLMALAVAAGIILTKMGILGESSTNQNPTAMALETAAMERVMPTEATEAQGQLTPAAVVVVEATATPSPTSTPKPTRTRVPLTPTPTSTRAQPTATPTRPLPTATATRVRPRPTATSVLPVVALVQPDLDAAGAGDQTFAWTVVAGALAPSQAFELIFWKQGQDPLADGFGLKAPTQDTQLQVDLDELDAREDSPLEPGEYMWGVRVLQMPGSKSVGMVGEPRRFRFERRGEPPTNPVSPASAIPDSAEASRALTFGGILGLVGVFGLQLYIWREDKRKR